MRAGYTDAGTYVYTRTGRSDLHITERLESYPQRHVLKVVVGKISQFSL